ncbi:MAG: hypothetical protein MJZ90_12305, partial [Bacteroidales bacterium]|nr:hypothetical protein [Bacteroidales bacterium]
PRRPASCRDDKRKGAKVLTVFSGEKVYCLDQKEPLLRFFTYASCAYLQPVVQPVAGGISS